MHRKIKWKPINGNLKIIQIYSKGLEYALVSEDDRQCHPFVWCKDFLHDVIFAAVNNRIIDIYKFRYDPKYDPLPSQKQIKLLITNGRDYKLKEKIPNTLDFLNQIESKLKIKKTIVRKCISPPQRYEKSEIFIFEGSRRWIYAPAMISFYSLLIRIGLCHTINQDFTTTLQNILDGKQQTYQNKDKQLLKKIMPAINKIVLLGDRKVFSKDIKKNYPGNLLVDTVHHNLGLLGFVTDMNATKTQVMANIPFWHQ